MSYKATVTTNLHMKMYDRKETADFKTSFRTSNSVHASPRARGECSFFYVSMSESSGKGKMSEWPTVILSKARMR